MRTMKTTAILLAASLAASSLAALAQPLPSWERIDNTAAEAITSAGTSGWVQVATSRTRLAVRSIDAGKTWSTLRIGSESPNFVVGHPVQDEVLYAAMAYVPPETRYGSMTFLYQSRDGGLTWRGGEPLLDGARVKIGEVRPGAHADLLYASRMVETICMVGCTQVPVEAIVSIDGGIRWRSIDKGIAGEERRLFPAASEPGTVYALTRSALWASRDMGTNWRQAVTANPDDEVLVDRIDASLVYLRNTRNFSLQVSEDAGVTWRTALHPDAQYSAGGLAADPLQRGRFHDFARDGRIFESRDAARTWRLLTLATSASGGGHPAAGAVAFEGTARMFTSASATSRVRVEADEYALGSGLWWNPSLGGMGVSLTQHESGQIFAVWFTYATDGSPTWYVMPGGKWEQRHRFDTTIFTARGMPAGAGWDPTRHSTTRVGTATLAFDQGTQLTLRFQFDDGRQGEVVLERQAFGQDVTRAAHHDYSDLWWDAGQPGWGIGIAHQRDRLFATWFTYDASGAPTWSFVSDAVIQRDAIGGPLRTTGTLHEARGGPIPGRAYDPATFTTRSIGVLGFTTQANDPYRMRMQSDAYGRLQDFDLTRQPF